MTAISYSNLLPHLPGYAIAEQLYAGSRTIVYRAVQKSSMRLVAIKLLQQDYPTFSELLQFRNQYTITKNLDIPGIIRPYSLEAYGNSYALVMEDFGGISLRHYTQSYSLSLLEILEIAVQITDILHDLCQHQVIHKDIKPANILIHPESKQVKLIDFSIASLLPRETQEIQNPNVLEGTLAYLSPEQTGRMNRGIDYRSDFYALGVTLYELLTGQLPFQSNDPMELVYCHLAKLPLAPHSINPKIPAILSDIVLKLMAKNAEDRYQSTLGLKYDLEYCLNQWKATGRIEAFVLGQRDVCNRFLIPEKLYGRETEVATLLEAFDRVANGTSEIMLVAGFSGIGKTAVINEVHKPIVRQRGYFIKGKYDQFQRNVPFSAFLEAFRDLIEQLLSESTIQLEKWKTKILAALGEQGGVITEVIPELEKIIGTQPAVTEIGGSAATNRFNLLFQKFIQVFTAKQHPLVIFIDDLQWADSASLNLMQALVCEKETKYLLLLGAYRDNEVSAVHPLMLTLDRIAQENIEVNTITLQPLSVANLNYLVTDALNCVPDIAQILTKIIYQKTQGNPFFTNQFLKTLYQEGLIYYNFHQGCWQCDLSQIKELSFADNVVDFIAFQLRKLPQETQEILKLAACIGNQFDLEVLAIVNNKSQEETATDLWKALQQGLIIPTNEVYKFFNADSDHSLLATDSENSHQIAINHNQLPTYKFLHDRVQQAAYSLIPEIAKKTTHFNIGQLLLINTPEIEIEDKIFNIVNQLNHGIELIQTQEELNKIAELNLIAGRKAKTSTAYTAAVKYLSLGLEIITEDSWRNQYAFCLALHEEACEAAYLSGNFEKMEELAVRIINSAQSLLDKIRVYETKIQANIVQNRLTEALKIAIDILKLLKIEFPEKPSQLDIQQAFQTIKEKLGDREIADLINLPEMTDLQTLAAMGILSSMFTAAYLGNPEFVPLVSLKMVELSIEHGNTGISANGYCTYAFLLCAVVGDIDSGYEFGELSLNVLSKTNATSLQAKVLLPYNSLVGHWKNHASNFLKPLQQVYQIALETGDLEFVGYALHNYSLGCYLTGRELTGLEQEMSGYCEVLKRLKQITGLGYVQIWQQTVLNLINKSSDKTALVGDVYNERNMLPIHQRMNDITAIAMVYFNKFTLSYLFGDLLAAFNYAVEAEKYMPALTSMLVFPAFYFYDSLVRLAAYFEVIPLEQNKFLEKVNANQEKMQHWANHAPMNFLHKYYLVEAERYRVMGEKIAAMDYFERAIAKAKENGYIQEEALANELAAKFYLNWDKEKFAASYMQEAYYCYARWGAKAKTDDLEQHYPNLLLPILQKTTQILNPLETLASIANISFNSSTKNSRSSSTSINTILDFAAILKASQSLSRTIQLDELLHQLTQIILQHSGGDRCALILPNKVSEWQLVAITTPNTIQLCSEPLDGNANLPVKLIHYVKNTQEVVMIDNLETNLPVIDEYLIQMQPKSVLCLPILNQGQLIGILYLHNCTTSGVFTSDRILILNFLCTQAAISLENARLYQQTQNYAQQLEQSQLHIVQSEKMASLGNLVAGVAHEINNPIGFLNGSISNAQDYVQDLLDHLELYQKYCSDVPTPVEDNAQEIELEFLSEDLPKLLDSMRGAVERIKGISTSLRTFSRADTEYKVSANLHDGINSTILILKYRLKGNEFRPAIQVIQEYGNLPSIECFPGQLNQVFMNILANAIDMFDEMAKAQSPQQIPANSQKITIYTEIIGNQVQIRIRDNGKGMTEDVKARIFDHLFTTKGVGKGTGLGLAIARQIVVDKHHGTLEVQSEFGHGSEFFIRLPING